MPVCGREPSVRHVLKGVTVMSYAEDYQPDLFAIDAAADARAAFIRRTYTHLFGAIMLFTGLSALILTLPNIDNIMMSMFQSGYAALIMFAGFIGASWVARYWANNSTSAGMQYAGLGLYAVAEAVFFAPLLWYAHFFVGPEVIPTAGMLSLVIFAGLTMAVFVTGADFSFLRTGLMVGAWSAFGLMIASFFFGFSLGLIFAYAMVVLASGFILYDTSNVLHHYRTDQHVGAALELFASVALLFWYVLRIVMAFSSDD